MHGKIRHDMLHHPYQPAIYPNIFLYIYNIYINNHQYIHRGRYTGWVNGRSFGGWGDRTYNYSYTHIYMYIYIYTYTYIYIYIYVSCPERVPDRKYKKILHFCETWQKLNELSSRRSLLLRGARGQNSITQHVTHANMLIDTPWHRQAQACVPLRNSSGGHLPYF